MIVVVIVSKFVIHSKFVVNNINPYGLLQFPLRFFNFVVPDHRPVRTQCCAQKAKNKRKPDSLFASVVPLCFNDLSRLGTKIYSLGKVSAPTWFPLRLNWIFILFPQFHGEPEKPAHIFREWKVQEIAQLRNLTIWLLDRSLYFFMDTNCESQRKGESRILMETSAWFGWNS